MPFITFLILCRHVEQWNLFIAVRRITQIFNELRYFGSGVDANGECGSNVLNTIYLDLATHLLYHALANT